MDLCIRLFNSVHAKNIIFHRQCRGLKSWTGGIKYPGFVYYPRNPDEKDPPYEPTKLLMVQRIKPFKRNDYRLKKILVDINLDGKLSDVTILKNTPEVCATLYRIKHLIKITPIRTPDGIPEDGDVGSGYLKENGEFIVKKSIDEKRFEASEEFITRPNRLDSDTLIKESRFRWMHAYL